MIENFRYNDVVLYSKGWYYKDGNMLEELGYIFSKVYGWYPKTEKAIAPMMLQVLDELDLKMERYRSIYQLYAEIQKYKDLYQISTDMAIILLVREILQKLSKDEIKINPPHYGKKEYFRIGCLLGKTPISMTYTEMNRRAQKMFA